MVCIIMRVPQKSSNGDTASLKAKWLMLIFKPVYMIQECCPNPPWPQGRKEEETSLEVEYCIFFQFFQVQDELNIYPVNLDWESK